jgi:hypothetical protein
MPYGGKNQAVVKIRKFCIKIFVSSLLLDFYRHMAYWWMIAIDAVSSVSVSSSNIFLLSKYKVKFLFKVNETRFD